MNSPTITTKEYVASCLPARATDSHKGTYGTLLTVCGSYGMAGAALLCARGALRSGVGLLRAALPQSVYPLLVEAVPEAVFLPMTEQSGCFCADAIPALSDALTAADAVVVPTEAILTSNEMQYVFVVEDGVARQTEVTTGLIGSGVTEITSGLKVGQQLVIMGQAYLDDGAAVRVVEG